VTLKVKTVLRLFFYLFIKSPINFGRSWNFQTPCLLFNNKIFY